MQKTALNSNIIFIGLFLAFVYFAYFSFYIFPSNPVSFDEYGYYNQAVLFSKGMLSLKLNEPNPVVLEPHIILVKNHAFSKYPPGFALVLAPFILLGIWQIVNPVLMVIGLFFVYRTLCSFLDKTSATFITLFTAFSPYSFGYAASLFSQPLAFMLSSGAIWAFFNYDISRAKKYLVYTGLFCAYGFLSRPLDFIFLTAAVNLGFFICCRPLQAFKNCFITSAIAFTGVILLVGYTSYQMGHFAVSAYDNVFHSTLFVLDPAGKTLLESIEGGLLQFAANRSLNILFFSLFLPFIGLINFIIFCIGILAIFNIRRFYVPLLYIILLVVIYNFHRTDGWSPYGARYWYATLGSFAVLAGAGWMLLKNCFNWLATKTKLPNITLLAALLIIAYNLYWIGHQTPKFMKLYIDRFNLMQTAEENMKSTCPEKTIVILGQHGPHPRLDFDKYIQDIRLGRNVFSDHKRIFIGPVPMFPGYKNLNTVRKLPGVEQMVEKNQYLYPDYKLCFYQIDYGLRF